MIHCYFKRNLTGAPALLRSFHFWTWQQFRVHYWQLWLHKDVSTAKHRRCIRGALMESLCVLLMRTAWSKMITDAKRKLAYRGGPPSRCKSVTLICKNAYLMKVVTLNNGMYLSSVNRSAANCTDAFNILNDCHHPAPTSRCAPVDSAHGEFILEKLGSTGRGEEDDSWKCHQTCRDEPMFVCYQTTNAFPAWERL